MTAAVAAPATGLARLRSLATGRLAWVVLLVVIGATLGIGSLRPAASSAAARASYLDTIIKCPSCDGLSISQSGAGVAAALRAEVAGLVDDGWSTPRIEARVEAQYGTDELLVPSSGVAWWLPTGAAALAAAGVAAVLVGVRRRRRRQASAEDVAAVAAALAEWARR